FLFITSRRRRTRSKRDWSSDVCSSDLGHSTGDEVLKHVAHTMEREMFLTDTKGQLFRFGGEEFIIVFRGKTPEQCIPIVKDLREIGIASCREGWCYSVVIGLCRGRQSC